MMINLQTSSSPKELLRKKDGYRVWMYNRYSNACHFTAPKDIFAVGIRFLKPIMCQSFNLERVKSIGWGEGGIHRREEISRHRSRSSQARFSAGFHRTWVASWLVRSRPSREVSRLSLWLRQNNFTFFLFMFIFFLMSFPLVGGKLVFL